MHDEGYGEQRLYALKYLSKLVCRRQTHLAPVVSTELSIETNLMNFVAFDSHNHLYVVDCSNHRVQKFNTNGEYLLQFGSKGASNGQLCIPYGITVHNNKVYIADHGNKRISVFQTNCKFFISFGSDLLGPY